MSGKKMYKMGDMVAATACQSLPYIDLTFHHLKYVMGDTPDTAIVHFEDINDFEVDIPLKECSVDILEKAVDREQLGIDNTREMIRAYGDKPENARWKKEAEERLKSSLQTRAMLQFMIQERKADGR